MCFSFQENSPRHLKSVVHGVVFERGVVLELVIEAEPGALADWAKIPEVERSDVQPGHGIAVELVITRIDGVRASNTIGRE